MVLKCGCMLSNYQCMRGCPVAPTVVCMGKPVFTMDVGPLTRWFPPPPFWGGLLVCVYSESQTVKSLLGILSHSGHCVTTGGIITKNCAPTVISACDVKQCGNALLDLFSY